MFCPQCASVVPTRATRCPTCSAAIAPELWRSVGEAETTLRESSGSVLVGPQVIDGRYRVERLLARGGMGLVYQGTDVRLQRKVAIKFLAEELTLDPSLMGRFLLEAQAAAAIDHPNVITVFAAGDHAGRPFMVMRFVDGETIGQRVQRLGPMALGEAVDVATQACHGLERIHAHGYIHRDIKPGNIMLEEGGRAIILDFGVLRTATSSFTRTGMVFGTLGFMPPEQATTPRLVDSRSDLYALSITLYFMLTGKIPFEAESPLELVLQQKSGKLPSARMQNPALPREIDAFFAKALAPEPDTRFQTAAELRLGMEPLLRGTPTSETEARELVLLKASGASASARDSVAMTAESLRRRRLVSAGVLVVMALTGLSLWLLWPELEGPSARRAPAEEAAARSPLPAPVPPQAEAVASPASPLHAAASANATDAGTAKVAAAAETAEATRTPTTARTTPTGAKGKARPLTVAKASDEESPAARASAAAPPSAPPAPVPPAAPAPPASPASPPAPEPAKMGRLRILTTQDGKGSWSEIAVDGRVLGHTHAVSRELRPGTHRVRVKREGFRDEERRVEISAGEETFVQIELKKAP